MPRDISGNYTLPVGNPVVSGTIIDVAWANPTMSDIATQLNNVITRDGVLPATNPIKFVDGSASAPSITFTGAPATGIYRSAATMGVAIAGTSVGIFNASGFQGAVGLPDGAAATPSLFFSGATTTGIYRSGTTIGFSIAGTSYGVFGTSGLVTTRVNANTSASFNTDVQAGGVIILDTSSSSSSPYISLTHATTSYGNQTSSVTMGPLKNVTGGPWGHWLFSGQTRRNLLQADFFCTTPMTIAQLPTAAQAGVGARAIVSDASNGVFRDVVVGGGATNVPIYSDGTNWRIG